MRSDTRQRKHTIAGLRAISGEQQMLGTRVRVIGSGKQALDAVMREMGRRVAESIMLIEREELAGPDYYPTHPGLQKWAHEAGSAYIGDQKVTVTRPRLRDGAQGEVPLKSYARLHAPGDCSEERLEKILRGVSAQKYTATVIEAERACGVWSTRRSRSFWTPSTEAARPFSSR